MSPAPGDDDLRAAEYVLGTLADDERAAFERDAANDPALRAAVQAWEARLAPLAGSVTAVEPDPRTWPLITARLAPSSSATAPGADVIALRGAVRRWRTATLAAAVLAACLALVIARDVLRTQPTGSPHYLAVVNRGAELPALVVDVDTRAGTVRVRSLAAEAPSDRSLELWFIGRGVAPRSLGVLSGARATIPAGLRGPDLDGASLAVSVEPRGGSPIGAPTGPVIYSGRLVQD